MEILEPGAIVMMVFSACFLIFTGGLLITSVNNATKRKAAEVASTQMDDAPLAAAVLSTEG